MSGVHFVTEPNQYLEPKVTKDGFGSREPYTVIHAFREAVRKFPNEKAMALKRPVNVRFHRNNISIISYGDRELFLQNGNFGHGQLIIKNVECSQKL